MNETETKAFYIDPLLKELGWGMVEGSRIRMEYPISQGRLVGSGKRNPPLKADYVLQYRNRNLAVIEAKSDEKHYTEGVGKPKIMQSDCRCAIPMPPMGYRFTAWICKKVKKVM
jgi:type I restriction enzyme R subunit